MILLPLCGHCFSYKMIDVRTGILHGNSFLAGSDQQAVTDFWGADRAAGILSLLSRRHLLARRMREQAADCPESRTFPPATPNGVCSLDGVLVAASYSASFGLPFAGAAFALNACSRFAFRAKSSARCPLVNQSDEIRFLNPKIFFDRLTIQTVGFASS